ncbi:hypothetical protein MJ122_23895 [Pseudomonas sp. DP-17]|nr:hypothetical protein [Pseudomonas sp. DP-17]
MGEVVVGQIVAREVLPAESDSDFLSFYREFDKRLDDLKDALARSKNTQTLAEALRGRGGFQNFIGGVTGRNDKELAEMVGDLGSSMEITQGILQMVMRVQNTKNRHLRDFHRSLVDKIADLQSDSATLDSNQREAAIAIVSELSDQVRAQLEQQEIVESHQKKLEHLDRFEADTVSLNERRDERVSELESASIQVSRMVEQQQKTIDALRSALAERDELLRFSAKRHDAQAAETEALTLQLGRLDKTIRLLGQEQGVLADRVGSMEKVLDDSRSIKSLVLRNLLPLLAVLASAASLVFALR